MSLEKYLQGRRRAENELKKAGVSAETLRLFIMLGEGVVSVTL